METEGHWGLILPASSLHPVSLQAQQLQGMEDICGMGFLLCSMESNGPDPK